MKNYIVTGPMGVTFGPGTRMKLSEDQASVRAHCLDEASDGVYEVRQRVMFKNGEEIGVAGDVNKALLSEMVDAESPTGKELKAKKKKAKKAKTAGKSSKKAAEKSVSNPPSDDSDGSSEPTLEPEPSE